MNNKAAKQYQPEGKAEQMSKLATDPDNVNISELMIKSNQVDKKQNVQRENTSWLVM